MTNPPLLRIATSALFSKPHIGKERPPTRLVTDLEIGKKYGIVITSSPGYMRYVAYIAFQSKLNMHISRSRSSILNEINAGM